MSRAARRKGSALVERPARVEASLWRRLRFEAQAECRLALFERYLGLARAIAARRFRQRSWTGVEKAELEQLACEGLLQAIDRFDPLRGVPFAAYAARRIAGSIADGLSRMSEIDAQLSHRRRLEQERLRSLASHPAAGEDAIGVLSELAVGLALGLMLEGTGLVEQPGGVDPAPNAYDRLEWRELQARLAREAESLPEKEALIVRQHYQNGLSFAQVAELLNLSRGRVSQLHRCALDRLRKRIGGIA